MLVEIDLDGTGRTEVSTGVPFFDHMLDALGKHGALDLVVRATGDVEIDAHHTVEDVAIVLGQALKQALGDKSGIRRFGDAWIPMDEALAQAVVDVSGRPYCVHTGEPEVMTGFVVGGQLPDGAQPPRVRVDRLPRRHRPPRPRDRRSRPAPHHRGRVQGPRPRPPRRHRARPAPGGPRVHQGRPRELSPSGGQPQLVALGLLLLGGFLIGGVVSFWSRASSPPASSRCSPCSPSPAPSCASCPTGGSGGLRYGRGRTR